MWTKTSSAWPWKPPWFSWNLCHIHLDTKGLHKPAQRVEDQLRRSLAQEMDTDGPQKKVTCWNKSADHHKVIPLQQKNFDICAGWKGCKGVTWFPSHVLISKQQFIWSTATCQPTWRCKAGVIRYVSVASGDTGVGLPRSVEWNFWLFIRHLILKVLQIWVVSHYRPKAGNGHRPKFQHPLGFIQFCSPEAPNGWYGPCSLPQLPPIAQWGKEPGSGDGTGLEIAEWIRVWLRAKG